MSLFQELKRRNVFRVAIAYVVTAWLLLQVADVVLGNIDAPAWVFKAFMLAIAIGFPIVLLFSWVYELTPEGVKREREIARGESITSTTARKLDRAIIATLVIALAYFVIDEVVFEPDSGAVPEIATTDDADNAAAPVAVTASSASTPDRSIAVLPFVNMSSDPEQEYFSDGISEELLNVLAKMPNLRVAARTSSFQFKGENQDIGKIARQLNVAHVLEGSVRKSGTKLRITAQLIKADDGYHLWSETYDRELDDVFVIQDEIAHEIGKAMRAELGLTEQEAQSVPGVLQAANTPAYEAFLRGRQLIHQRGRNSLEEAVQHLERSLRLDANYAPAHAHLAIATTLLLESGSTYGELSMEEVKSRAWPHINQAFELAPELPEAYAARALLESMSGNLQESIADTRKALSYNPSYTDAIIWQRGSLLELGRYAEAQQLLDELLEVDPLTVIGRINLANQLIFFGQYEEAHSVADDLLEQSPWASYAKHADAALSGGNVADSVTWGLKAFAVNPNDLASNFTLTHAFAWVSMFDEARRVSDPLLAFAEMAAGRNTEAVDFILQRLTADPENTTLMLDAANISYFAGQLDRSLELFEQFSAANSDGKIPAAFIVESTRIAWLKREAGEIGEASDYIARTRSEIQKMLALGPEGSTIPSVEAMIAAYDGDPDAVIESIDLAVTRGARQPLYFREPIFENVRDNQAFIDLETRVLQALEIERGKTLEMICSRNPVPDAWQPLPETCATAGIGL